MNHQSQLYKACSSDTLDRVEQYFHIVSVLGRTGGTDGKQCIVLEFARYTYESGQVVNKTMHWHGPFVSTRAAKALIRSRRVDFATPKAGKAATPRS